MLVCCLQEFFEVSSKLICFNKQFPILQTSTKSFNRARIKNFYFENTLHSSIWFKLHSKFSIICQYYFYVLFWNFQYYISVVATHDLHSLHLAPDQHVSLRYSNHNLDHQNQRNNEVYRHVLYLNNFHKIRNPFNRWRRKRKIQHLYQKSNPIQCDLLTYLLTDTRTQPFIVKDRLNQTRSLQGQARNSNLELWIRYDSGLPTWPVTITQTRSIRHQQDPRERQHHACVHLSYIELEMAWDRLRGHDRA